MSEEKKIEDGGPAYPVVGLSQMAGQELMAVYNRGMTKREWFAGMALMGLCANVQEEHADKPYAPEVIAKIAYGLADAMIQESQKKEK